MRKKLNRNYRRFLWVCLGLFIGLNVIAAFHAYKFTHFFENVERTSEPEELNAWEKIKVIATGVKLPHPVNKEVPKAEYNEVWIDGSPKLHAWEIPKDSAKGIVLLFHGYGGEKSGMLPQAEQLHNMGYSTVLTDFMGSGLSEGNNTTIGFKEAEQVKRVYDRYKTQDGKIILMGTSMGAVAIMKCLQDYSLEVDAIILECPFGTMYKTVEARFDQMGIPRFPMAGILMFWGGVENGFWAFGHNPVDYAKSIDIPSLLLYGKQDPKVSMEETNTIFENLKGFKMNHYFEHAGHENFAIHQTEEWQSAVLEFLSKIPDKNLPK
ncbi:alpha/beta hydrolase [bacterium]|nr:alpha/beta hydrolase [bacterium]